MKCFYCKGEMRPDVGNYMADLNGHFIIVRNVPCHTCSQCGEVSFNISEVKKIEGIIANLQENFTEVAVVDYAA